MRSTLAILCLTAALAAGPACGSGGGGDDGGASDGGADNPDAPIPGDYQDPLVRLQTVGNPGGVSHPAQMVVRNANQMLYCGSPGGLYLVDIGDGADVRHQTNLRPNGDRSCQHLALSDEIVVTASRGDTIAPPSVAAFDLGSSPPTPLPGFTRPDLSYEGIAVAGRIAYVAVHDNGLLVLDWTGGAPVEVANLTAGFSNAWAVALSGSTLFVADAGFGLVSVDVSNPASPTILGSVAIDSGAAQAIATNGSHAFVAMATGGVAVVDVTNPAQPSLVATVETPGSATELSLSGDHLAVADWDDIRVFDISTPSAPTLIASEAVLDSNRNFTRFLGVAIDGDRVIGGEFNGALYSHQLFADRIAPDIRVESYSASFTRTDPGSSDAIALIVRNEGNAPLVATSLQIEGSVFSTTTTSFALDPGDATVVELVYTPTSSSEDVGELVIETDDPDELTSAIGLSGNSPTLQAGDAAPEVEIALLAGGTWRLSEQQGQVVVLAYFATF